MDIYGAKFGSQRMDINFLTVEEFAKKVKMHPTSVRRAIKKGHIYAVRPSLGKKAPYRIAESELERLQLKSMCENKK
jgi:excisionase family DNA binding protein